MHAKLRSLGSAIAVTAALSMSAVVQAQTPAPAAEVKPPADPYTITGNFGIYSQYVFRGLTQTDGKPAFQGGFDFTHTNGWYAGTWGSNISWIHDQGSASPCDHGCSLEWDLYGGYRYAINDDWGTDVGVLYYFYPGSYLPGAIKPNTTEVYASIAWKWLSLKFSDSLTNTFGVSDAKGTYYLDLSANYPINDVLTLNAHVGTQQYHGNGGSNDDAFSYTDWKLGVTWVYNGYNIGAYWTDSNAKDAGYTIANRNIGDSTGVVFVQKTF